MFHAPQRLDAGGQPAVAINETGSAVIAWTGADGAVHAALRTQHGPFSESSVLSEPHRAANDGPLRLATAMNARGDVVVAWLEPPAYPDPNTVVPGRVMAAMRPAGGPFTTSQEIVEYSGNYKGVEAGLDDAGRVTLAWQADGTWVANGDVNRGLGSPQPAGGDPNAQTQDFSLAVTPAGDATLVATLGPFAKPPPAVPPGVYVSTKPPGGEFGPLRSVAQTGGPPFSGAYNQRLSVGPGGAAAVVWTGGAGANFNVKPAGGDWLGPQTLDTGAVGSQPEKNPRDGVVGIDARGRTVFAEALERGFHTALPITVVRRLPSGKFEAPVKLGSARARNVGPAIAFDGIGNGILVWEGGDTDPGNTPAYDTTQPIKVALYDGSAPTIESFALAKRRTRFRVRLSEPARLDVTIRRSRHTVARMHARVKLGTRLVRIPRGVRRKMKSGGRYVATATARDSANRRSRARRVRF